MILIKDILDDTIIQDILSVIFRWEIYSFD